MGEGALASNPSGFAFYPNAIFILFGNFNLGEQAKIYVHGLESIFGTGAVG